MPDIADATVDQGVSMSVCPPPPPPGSNFCRIREDRARCGWISTCPQLLLSSLVSPDMDRGSVHSNWKRRSCKTDSFCHSKLMWRKIRRPTSLASLTSSPPLYLQEQCFGIDDMSLDPRADLCAHGPLGAGYWKSVIGGHNAFSPVSRALGQAGAGGQHFES